MVDSSCFEKNIVIYIFVTCPIIEELIFEHTGIFLLKYFSFGHTRLFLSILFLYIHFNSNYNVYENVSQSIFTFDLRFLLIAIDDLYFRMILHAFYNLVTFAFLILINNDKQIVSKDPNEKDWFFVRERSKSYGELENMKHDENRKYNKMDQKVKSDESTLRELYTKFNNRLKIKYF